MEQGVLVWCGHADACFGALVPARALSYMCMMGVSMCAALVRARRQCVHAGLTLFAAHPHICQDVFVANTGYSDVNHLYLGDGSGGFSRVTTGEIATDSADSYGAALGDVNGDGHVVRRRCDGGRVC